MKEIPDSNLIKKIISRNGIYEGVEVSFWYVKEHKEKIFLPHTSDYEKIISALKSYLSKYSDEDLITLYNDRNGFISNKQYNYIMSKKELIRHIEEFEAYIKSSGRK